MVNLLVEEISKYGFKSGGQYYGIGKRLQQKGVTPQSFQVGSTIEADIWTSDGGKHYLNSFKVVPSTSVSAAPTAKAVVATAPSLPSTSLPATPAPGGVAPVSPAVPKPEYNRKKDPQEARAIELQAILKSTLESPALAQLAVGKQIMEVQSDIQAIFNYCVSLYDQAKNG